MSRIYVLLCAALLLLSSCHTKENKTANEAQRLLTEADLLLETRDFKKARETIVSAKEKIHELRTKHPEDVDFILLSVRANLTNFLADNILIIERATPDPESLVRIPDPAAYKGYEQLLVPSVELLKRNVGNPALSVEQDAALHTLLASIYRLKRENTDDSLMEYGEALRLNRKYLHELLNTNEKLKPNNLTIQRVKNQIQELLQAKIEVELLAEKWDAALGDLQYMMAGDDLKYFDIQFELLESQLLAAEARLAESLSTPAETKAQKIKELIRKRRIKKHSQVADMGGINPIEAEILQVEIRLAETKNNLIYRIICYYHNGNQDSLLQSREILRRHYPDTEMRLTQLLNQSSHNPDFQ